LGQPREIHRHLTKSDDIAVIVGYLHKVVPLRTQRYTASDVLNACKINSIPVIVIAQKAEHKKAKEALGDIASYVTIVDPTELMDGILKVI